MSEVQSNPPAIVRPAEAPPERHGVCTVFLKINVTFYAVKCMRTPEGKVWRLRKPDGQTYDVHRGRSGFECTCWDFIYRWANRDSAGCKHCRALSAAGLLD